MAERSSIEWTDASWNPITGCSPCSPGCAHCYARALARFRPATHALGVPFEQVFFHPERLAQPSHWRGHKTCFVCSMGDLFHEQVRPECLEQVFCTMRLHPWHRFLVLTKRPQNIPAFLEWPDNVWGGVTAENSVLWHHRIGRLRMLPKLPWERTFVSAEPLLEMPSLRQMREEWPAWVIVGGESGAGARPLDTAWVREIIWRAQSFAPVFVKQLGSRWAREHGHTGKGHSKGQCMEDWPEDLRVRQTPWDLPSTGGPQ
jgi:protein gp37